ncbi:acetyl-CoA carboxylase, biotin carboxyl carrier protein [Vagococcus sp. PNs007]|uniref:Biotin carboxyl carrier protein of acetyl-CoA carboxylase n=1 Tax=Vagococcus proximus TaxID=2991417 RepID=A0ABT5X1Z7_9ENTE|nr:acetyl-CoA carboxylase, biotin carboxyl carrier protein [Vagococcus proximus]
MKHNELKDLITSIDHSSIREFNFETNDYKLYINKNEMTTLSKPETTVVSEVAPSAVAKENQDEVAPLEDKVVPQADGEYITSPLVGIAYSSSDPTSQPFKKVGDTVEIGETVCIVESMKIMNDIPSPLSGTVSKVLFSNEEVVEFGQPLFEIQSN